MPRKCTKISLGKIDHKIFLILVGAIFQAVLTFIEDQTINFSGKNKHPIIYTIIYSLGLCLNFILLIILKFRNKSAKNIFIEIEKDKEKHSFHALLLDKDKSKSLMINTSVNTYTMPIKHTKKKKKYLWILLVSVIDYIAYVFYSIFWIGIDNYINIWGIVIGFISIFSYKILQMKLFRHHYLCIIIIIIFGLSSNFITRKFHKENFRENYPYYLNMPITEILFSLVNVMHILNLIKYYLLKE